MVRDRNESCCISSTTALADVTKNKKEKKKKKSNGQGKRDKQTAFKRMSTTVQKPNISTDFGSRLLRAPTQI
jgi:hypothetical protein